MAGTTIICNECGKTLKSTRSLDAGTKVRCPQCQTVNVVSQGDVDEEGGITTMPARTAAGLGEYDDDETTEWRPDDDDDEQKIERRRPTRAVRGNGLRMGLIIGGVALVAVAAAAFMWLRFRPPQIPPGSGQEALEDYLSDRYEGAIGFNFSAMDANPNGKLIGLGIQQQFAMHAHIDPKLQSLLQDADHILLHGPAEEAAHTGVAMIRLKKDFDPGTIRQRLNVRGGARTAHGVVYYATHGGEFAALPTRRLVIIARMQERAFRELLSKKKAPPLLKAQIAKLKTKAIYTVALNENMVKIQLQNIRVGGRGGLPNDLAPIVVPVQRCKSMAASIAFTEKGMDGEVRVQCIDAKDTAVVTKTVKKFHEEKIGWLGGIVRALAAFNQFNPNPKADIVVLDEMLRSLRFRQEDHDAIATAQVSNESLEALFQQMAPGVGMFPNKQ